MGLEFKSNKLMDIAIFSGVEYKYENQVPPGLIGDAAQGALAELKTSYENYKKNLNFKYGKFLTNVEANLKHLNSTNVSSDARSKVATKLTELAQDRISNKESNFSGARRFFHKVGQLFKGHGYRTKGEWGLEVASRMQKVESEIYKTQLQSVMFGGFAFRDENITAMKDKINGLPEKEFKDILNKIVFKSSEGHMFGSKRKLVFYNMLTDEKKKVFAQELLARPDWYQQAFDIVEGSEEGDVASFIAKNPAMVKKFQENPAEVIRIYRGKKDANVFYKRFFDELALAAIQDYLDQNSLEGYQKISALLNQHMRFLARVEFVQGLQDKLGDENYQKLKDNVDLNTWLG
jgi:hypothetical protein